MKSNYFLGLDQGTTGSTAVITAFTPGQNPQSIGRATIEFPQYFPQPGWVEHDLDEIWSSVRTACKKAIEMAQANDPNFRANLLAGIGITNQRETLCAFSRQTGAPVAKAIVWQCKRSEAICRLLRDDGLQNSLQEKTGLVLDPYFSGTKIRWLMENNESVAQELKQNKTLLGTIDTYLLFRLTAGQSYMTEASNASRTQLFNLHNREFDSELLNLMKVPSRNVLPEIRPSACLFGKTKGLDFLPDGIPISGILGDQQAALAGQTCFSAGEMKCTYGTGAFLLFNTANKIVRSKSGLLTTVAWGLGDELTFALEGSVFIAGAAVQFLRDQLHFIATSSQIEPLAKQGQGSPQVYFVPALSGLGAPQWDPSSSGSIFGLTRGTSQADIARATLEGVAFSVFDLVRAMVSDTGQQPQALRVDGGAAANNELMQIQANINNFNVDRPANLETTALGATMFAALGVGYFSSLQEIAKARMPESIFYPEAIAQKSREQKILGWERAILATQVFAGTRKLGK